KAAPAKTTHHKKQHKAAPAQKAQAAKKHAGKHSHQQPAKPAAQPAA
ncbi:acid resistance repetitive basic protein Asr, partial [Shigella sonnei]